MVDNNNIQTQISAEQNSSVDGGEQGTIEVAQAAAQAIVIEPPVNGETLHVALEPGQPFGIKGLSMETATFAQQGADVVVTLPDGGTVVLDKYLALAGTDLPPAMTLEDGSVITADDLLGQIDGLDLASIDPAGLTPAGQAAGGGGGAGFGAYEPGSIGDGLNLEDLLNYTELSFGQIGQNPEELAAPLLFEPELPLVVNEIGLATGNPYRYLNQVEFGDASPVQAFSSFSEGGSDSGWNFIELYNPTADAAVLGDFGTVTLEVLGQNGEVVSITLPVSFTVPAGGFLVVYQSTDAYNLDQDDQSEAQTFAFVVNSEGTVVNFIDLGAAEFWDLGPDTGYQLGVNLVADGESIDSFLANLHDSVDSYDFSINPIWIGTEAGADFAGNEILAQFFDHNSFNGMLTAPVPFFLDHLANSGLIEDEGMVEYLQQAAQWASEETWLLNNHSFARTYGGEDSTAVDTDAADDWTTANVPTDGMINDSAASAYYGEYYYGSNGDKNWFDETDSLNPGQNDHSSYDDDAGQTVLVADEENPNLYGGRGPDFLYGSNGEGEPAEEGQAVDNLIHGEANNDFIYGGGGDDRSFGDSGGDVVLDIEGQDVLVGGSGKDLLAAWEQIGEFVGGYGESGDSGLGITVGDVFYASAGYGEGNIPNPDGDLLVGDNLYNIDGELAEGEPSVIVSTEGNDTLATAQEIARSDFGIAPTGDVADDSLPRVVIEGTNDGYDDQDLFSITLKAGETITLDIDYAANSGVSVDTVLTVYDAEGNIVAQNDDSSTDNGGDGSSSSLDSFITFTATEDAVYYFGVTNYGNFPEDGAVAGYGEGYYSSGDWVLNVSLTSGAVDNDAIIASDDSDVIFGDNLPLFDLDPNDPSVSNYDIFNNVTDNVLSLIEDDPISPDDPDGLLARLHAEGEGDAIYGAGGDDIIFGQGGEDIILGGYGSDLIYGGGDNDWIQGNDGSDVILGGEGNDVIEGNDGKDRLYGEAGDDTMYGNDDADEMHGGDGEDDMWGGDGADLMYGDADADLMYGDADEDTMFGGTGEDTMFGGTGNDVMDGGADNDIMVGEDGNDLMYGQAGDDVMYGNADDDTMFGGDGNDIMNGGTGNDLMAGGDDDDLMIGDDGADWMYGQSGEDVMYGNADADSLYGGTGNDTMDGGSGNDTLYGDADNDLMKGGSGEDFLSGGTGNDDLWGGADDDVIRGNEGDDDIKYWRGEGEDTVDGGADYDQYFVTGWNGNAPGFADSFTVTVDGVDDSHLDVDVQGQVSDVTGVEQLRFYTYGGDDSLTIAGDFSNTDLDADAFYYSGGADSDTVDASGVTSAHGVEAHGEAGDDVLLGGAGDDSLYGGDGDDAVIGGAGNDFVEGDSGSGNDLLIGDNIVGNVDVSFQNVVFVMDYDDDSAGMIDATYQGLIDAINAANLSAVTDVTVIDSNVMPDWLEDIANFLGIDPSSADLGLIAAAQQLYGDGYAGENNFVFYLGDGEETLGLLGAIEAHPEILQWYPGATSVMDLYEIAQDFGEHLVVDAFGMDADEWGASVLAAIESLAWENDPEGYGNYFAGYEQTAPGEYDEAMRVEIYNPITKSSGWIGTEPDYQIVADFDAENGVDDPDLFEDEADIAAHNFDQFDEFAIDPGEMGEDVLIGGDGEDVIFGDTILLPTGVDQADLLQAAADGTLKDFVDTNIVDHDALLAVLNSVGESDTIDAGAGDDLVFGQGGDDTITGGAGDDAIYGGEGADTFVYTDAGTDGDDVILDFEVGVDTISVDALFDALGVADADRGGEVQFADDGGDLVVTISNAGATDFSITLEGVAGSVLTVGDDDTYDVNVGMA